MRVHLHMHSRAVTAAAGSRPRRQGRAHTLSRTALLGLIDNLDSTVRRLRWQPADTRWGDYYQDTNYSETAMEHKRAMVSRYVERLQADSVWDLGANTGVFSRLWSSAGIRTVSMDSDPAAVQKSYQEMCASSETHLLPLRVDLANPSPALGWQLTERDSLIARGPADVCLALALVHHLAIGNNVPLPDIAEFFVAIARKLVVEFVPKADSQVAGLLADREDVFPGYTTAGFEAAFGARFRLLERNSIPGTERTLYLYERHP